MMELFVSAIFLVVSSALQHGAILAAWDGEVLAFDLAGSEGNVMDDLGASFTLRTMPRSVSNEKPLFFTGSS